MRVRVQVELHGETFDYEGERPTSFSTDATDAADFLYYAMAVVKRAMDVDAHED